MLDLLPKTFRGCADALDEYTNKRGGEVRDWTPTSIEERIDAITERCQRAGLCFGAAVFAIYRPSSELLHGTYYGVNYFWLGSRDRPARSRVAFDHLWLLEHFVTLLSAMFFGASGAIDAIAAVFDLPEHSALQDQLAKELTELIDDMNNLDNATSEKD